MRHPEEIVGLFSYAWMCKNKYEHNYDVKDYAGQAGKRLEKKNTILESGVVFVWVQRFLKKGPINGQALITNAT